MLAGLLGIGGGVVMVPAMMLVLGLSPVVAKGTSLAVIVPTIIGTWASPESQRVDVRGSHVGGPWWRGMCGDRCSGGRSIALTHAEPIVCRTPAFHGAPPHPRISIFPAPSNVAITAPSGYDFVMGVQRDLVNSKREHILQVVHANRGKHAYLFGSTARGEDSASSVWICSSV